VAACVPLVLGVTSVAAALGALGLVSQVAPNGSSTAPVVVLIGLAVGVDYSLFYSGASGPSALPEPERTRLWTLRRQRPGGRSSSPGLR
ncbi:MAG TPA: hypothetical protein VG325_10220, partial [Solirubrobacteraceae bacterium]|nr:hypothetical protein [Solirubrobacteraceae bacterium]